ncbi:Superfamily II DNA or RNA helicase, SNF2 family [Filimonas lacunae]|uniref:Superfamily II DNA or RNA helicase, SNF2 family n=1 Tax=Filimonas lacunae TaxID=477680 RepID=A0A173MCF7_9BACT|nr:DEAD/DEAH box helicase [Filimonas lacunae]BAV05235.1 superfamily II DNA/RNA helicases, SNF2 family [Filimonas lacunae]SIT22469.1 Superfamily II DNA or RNA helicase, SNF2 family [Filimonas lacunae]
MAVKQNDHKTVLLLSPHRLLGDYQQVLESLHIIKYEGSKVEYIPCKTDAAEVKEYYPHLSKPAKEALPGFTREGIKELKEQLKERYNKLKPESDFDTFYQHAAVRRLQELFEPLKAQAAQVKWYHKVEMENGNFKTSPCNFSGLRPMLQFEVSRSEEGELQLNCSVFVSGGAHPLSEYKRSRFLLEREGEYYLLTHTDYTTLQWLEQKPERLYNKTPQAFAQHILAKLEGEYTVRRNNLFAGDEVKVVPQNRIVLSEIHPSYLVITPQWLYDEFSVEGAFKETMEVSRDGKVFQVVRDRAQEEAFLQLLESLHESFPNQKNGYYHITFDEARKKQWFLKVYHRLLELDVQVVGMDMLQHFRYSTFKVATTATIVKEEANAVTLQMSVSFGKEEISLVELQKQLFIRQHMVLLKDTSLGVLDDEWLQRYSTLLRHGKVAKNMVTVSRWLAFCEQQATEDTQVLKQVIPKPWWEKWELWQKDDGLIYDVPAGLKATLRPYQQKGYEWLSLLAEAGAGACLADDMGLGKTLQTITFLAQQSHLQEKAVHLIVCPSSLLFNWQQELNKFAPHLKTLVHYGNSRNTPLVMKKQHQVVITSYGTLRADIEELSTMSFAVVALDESHHIKNPSAQITRAVSRLQASFGIALSGTPVMNNTFDLYAQMNFLLPGMFGNREFFKREYADAIDRNQDEVKIKALHKLTSPFILRRTKQQVASDLPPKTEMVMWCNMEPAQKALYDEIKESIKSSVFMDIAKDGLGKSTLALLQGMLRLRQLCNSPLLLPENDRKNCTESVKTDLLMEELSNNLKDHKVLVFSQFASMLRLLADGCKERGLAYYHFDGSTPPAQRAEMANAFQEPGNKVNIFLISLKAGNAGLNLTAADYVFLFDPWWNTAVQQQAIDRAHRIGQTKNVFAYKMICKDTIEERIIQLQQQKHALAGALVTEEEGDSFVKSLTEEDVAYLFS